MQKQSSLFEEIAGAPEHIVVNEVFGKPQTVGEKVLIPVAEIMYGFGAVEHEGPTERSRMSQPAIEISNTLEDEAAYEGGGGAVTRARPLAYIEVTPQGTSIQPVEDKEKLLVAGILLTGWIFGWLTIVLKVLFHEK